LHNQKELYFHPRALFYSQGFFSIQSDGVWFLATVALLLAWFELAQLGLFSV